MSWMATPIEHNAKSSHPLRRGLRILRFMLAWLGLLFLIATQTPVDMWWARLLSGPHDHPKGDVLVVLAGGLLRDDILDAGSYARSTAALRAWREGGFKALVLSGGAQAGLRPTAEAMREFLAAEGVPREAIKVETSSHSTRENAIFVKAILDAIPGRKVLITSDAHMYRARRAFQRVGLEVAPRPCPDVETEWRGMFGGWDAFVVLAAETGKIGYYYVRGWI